MGSVSIRRPVQEWTVRKFTVYVPPESKAIRLNEGRGITWPGVPFRFMSMPAREFREDNTIGTIEQQLLEL
jgi:hypothetical protein